MMSPKSCVLALLVLVLLCKHEVHGFDWNQLIDAGLVCPPGADVGDACYTGGVGTCKKVSNKPWIPKACVPPSCGSLPSVVNGQYEEFACLSVYTCARVACDPGFSLSSGDLYIICTFNGWLNQEKAAAAGATCAEE